MSTFKPTDDQSSDLVKIDQEADVENLQEDRATVEKRMLFKLDLRMSYLIVLYILNIVRPFSIYRCVRSLMNCEQIDRGNTP